MIRCVMCGSSRLDAEGVKCARCGGAPAVPWEQCHIDEETQAKLLAHAEDLKKFGVKVEQQQTVRKDAATVMAAVALGLQVVESFHPHVLRDLVLYLRDLAIPEEQIIRLRLEEPEKISQVLNSKALNGDGKKRSPVGKKRVGKKAKK
jgi:hypothetical protein